MSEMTEFSHTHDAYSSFQVNMPHCMARQSLCPYDNLWLNKHKIAVITPEPPQDYRSSSLFSSCTSRGSRLGRANPPHARCLVFAVG